MKVAINSFVRRQTADSKFSHFDGPFDAVITLAVQHLPSSKVGYKAGVIVVPVPADRFYSGVVEVTDGTALKATSARRRPEEDLYIDVVAVGAKKLPAAYAVGAKKRRSKRRFTIYGASSIRTWKTGIAKLLYLNSKLLIVFLLIGSVS